MSYEAIRWALDVQGVTPHEKLVLIALANHLNDRTGQLNPSILRMEKLTSLSRWSIMRALITLETKRKVSVSRQKGARNTYSIAFVPGDSAPKPAEVQEEPPKVKLFGKRK